MLTFAHIVYEIIIWGFLLYSAAVLLVYGWIGIYALGAVLRYKKENTFTDYTIVATNKNAPLFSVIAPAYNEGVTIVDNVRSLLSLYYHNLEIIVVNDGSRDDSMEKLIEVYELEPVSFFVQGNIPTKKIRNVYKSKNPAFRKLVVVDKENGGKADALNVGVNVSSGAYIVCIDVDCILEQDAVLKLAKPILEQTDKRVIACGGVIRLANNCKIENGKVVEVDIPKTWLGRTQALEYIRAFVLGRMAWSRASGLILISGAFGAFDKSIVLACGGYDTNTVGEDIELVVRMRKYMEERKEPYEVVNIPDPLCWTEVPEDKEVLKKQRNRWMRGTMETLWKHRNIMFNPKYGKLGCVSLPYWFLFEFLGPLIEFSGYIIFIIFLLLGIVNWSFFFVLFALVISTGILYSIYAVLVDLVSHQVYSKRKDFLSLIATAVLEPFYFHPLVVKAGVSGFRDYFKKTHSWGNMTRQGFNQVEHLTFKQKVKQNLQEGLKQWGKYALIFLVLFLIGVLAEWLWYHSNLDTISTSSIALSLFTDNVIFALQFIAIIGVLFLILRFITPKGANKIVVVLGTLTIVLQYILFLYFYESHNILGADVFYYSTEEMKQIIKASGMLNAQNIALVFILFVLAFIPFRFAVRSSFKSVFVGIGFIFLGFLSFFIPKQFHLNQVTENEFEQNAAKSKWAYFAVSNTDNFLNENPELFTFWKKENVIETDIEQINSDFPFWKKENTKDFLGSYFNKSEKTPNLVMIVVEGLGHAYSSSNGYIGNFTPFLDSLTNSSLYWEFNMSSSGRTFSALPTLTGSLPFGKNGFLELDKIPEHFNLYNVLKHNGFETGFYYGGNASFDRMKSFLEYSKVDHIIEQESFEAPYRKLPENNGESWGYEDQAVFGKMLKIQQQTSKPYFNILLTLSTHNPFLINNTAYYEKLFNKRVASNELSQSQKKWALSNKKQLISVLNLDDALKDFFAEYAKRSDFNNTIFIITGDHSMPEIPLQSKIDRYHVPLVIYSPLLKEKKRFRNTVSHFDIAPSVLAYYRDNYGIKTPSTTTWIGKGLRGSSDRIPQGIAMMQSKNQLIDFVYGKYHISGDRLFSLQSNLTEDEVIDNTTQKEIEQRFSSFKNKNNKFYSMQKIMPDSVMIHFMKNN